MPYALLMIYQQLSLYVAWITLKNQFKPRRLIDKLADIKYYYDDLIELGWKSTMGKPDIKLSKNSRQ